METNSTHPTHKLEHLTFTVVDYSMFIGMLVLSAMIGVYFGFYKKQNTTSDYLLGGKNMGIFPVAISLAASYVSAITLLGMPAEIYTYGTQYATSCIAGFMMSFVIGNVYLPVFYRLQLTSSFEYLSLRFDESVRLMVSFLYLLGFIMTIPIVMYVPALAFNLVSGMDLVYIVPIVCFVCIFYTTIGGLKAVVWADTLQFLTMNGAILVILVLGTPHEGGLARIWKLAQDSDRVHFFDADPSLYTRATMWSVTIGMCMSWISGMGVNQMCIQRFLSVPTLADANKVLYIYCAAITIIKALCLFSGLIMFARYNGCDPLSTGIIQRSDQILPYYVMDTTRGVPGLPGLFIAGVFSAALSTMSSLLNTACGVIYKDFICRFLDETKISENRASNILKSLVVVLGIVCMAMVFVVQKLGNILEMSISFGNLTSGAMLGAFTLGVLVPRANSKGVLAGCAASMMLIAWALIGSKRALAAGVIKYAKKPLSVEECDFFTNVTSSPVAASLFDLPEREEDLFFLYRISFMWYSLIGTLTVMIVGIPVSYMTSPPDLEQLKPEYFSPVIEKYLPQHIKDNITKQNVEYHCVPVKTSNGDQEMKDMVKR